MKNRQFWMVAGLLSLLMSGMVVARTSLMTEAHPFFKEPWDHHKYIYMALEGPGKLQVAPFCWRILAPLAARSLPFGLQTNFLLIACLAVAATGVLMIRLMLALGFERRVAIFALPMYYSAGWAVKLPISDFWLVDASTIAVCTLLVILAVEGRAWLFAAVLAVAVMLKENTLFTVPLFYTFGARKWIDWRQALRTGLVAAAGVVMLLSVRAWIPQQNENGDYLKTLPVELRYTENNQSSYRYAEILPAKALARVRGLNWKLIQSYTVGAYGILFVLPFFALERNRVLLARFAPFLFLVYLQTLFAENIERQLAVGIAAVVAASLNGLRDLGARMAMPVGALAAAPAMIWGLNLIIPTGYSTPFELQAMVFLIYLGCLTQWRRASAAAAAR